MARTSASGPSGARRRVVHLVDRRGRVARDVLGRPALRKLHGLTVAEVETLLTDIALHAIVLAPGVGSPAPDPGDQLLWDLLAARADLLLVTGDKALQRDPTMQARVQSPQAFVESSISAGSP